MRCILQDLISCSSYLGLPVAARSMVLSLAQAERSELLWKWMMLGKPRPHSSLAYYSVHEDLSRHQACPFLLSEYTFVFSKVTDCWGLAVKNTAAIIWPLLFSSCGKGKVSGIWALSGLDSVPTNRNFGHYSLVLANQTRMH